MSVGAFVTLDDGTGRIYEQGPFAEVVFMDGGELYVDGSLVAGLDPPSGIWTVSDGAALGDPSLSGQKFPIVFGLAKAY